jgi:hypothetical protein
MSDPYYPDEPLATTLRRIIQFLKQRASADIMESNGIELEQPQTLQQALQGITPQTYLLHTNQQDERRPLLTREVQDALRDIYRMKEEWSNNTNKIQTDPADFVNFKARYTIALDDLMKLLNVRKFWAKWTCTES